MKKIISRIKFWINYLFKFFININFSYIKYFKKWIYSMKSNSMKDESPWITFESRDFLDTCLNKDQKVFEWGSGGSTIYFSSRVNKIVSMIKDKKIDNIEYLLIEPKKKSKSNSSSYFSSDINYTGKDFFDYCEAINNYPDNYFDLIVVDGRVRNCCVNKAIKKLNSDGIILLDNSDVKEYNSSLELLKKLVLKVENILAPVHM